jgi:SAM-dependent methyltransferase
MSDFQNSNDDINVDHLSKIQALFRGKRSRDVHVKRAKAGCSIICPFVSSSMRVVNSMLSISNIKSTDLLLDLGSGDGTILVEVAKQTGAKCIGYEIDKVLCGIAKRRVRDENITSLVDIVEEDILNVDYTKATIIFMFLVPSCLKVLSPILKTQCAKGTSIICYKFPLPNDEGWESVIKVETEDVVKTKDPTSSSSIWLYYI